MPRTRSRSPDPSIPSHEVEISEGTTPHRPSRRGLLGRRFRLGLVVVLAVAVAVVFRRPLFLGNFGNVDPGRVFRSAQPGSGFEAMIAAHDLGAVMNLRGGTDRDRFYRHETELAQRRGVEFYDLPLSAVRRPSRRDLMMAVSVLDRCRYPLLIHCKWGSDRTGLVSALYRLVILGESPDQVVGEFAIGHGHFPIFGPEKLHEPIDEYGAWLEERGLEHRPARFRTWLERHYRAPDAFIGWPEVPQGPRVPPRIGSRPGG